jgi:hypothetical protein
MRGRLTVRVLKGAAPLRRANENQARLFVPRAFTSCVLSDRDSSNAFADRVPHRISCCSMRAAFGLIVRGSRETP